ncbi:MAG: DUF4126 family protein [Pseudomonadales bacterium]|nr:DUF4126 family protein [Pseudomonadales bacterium]
MDDYQTLVQVIALTMGAAWASGINLYATVAVLGIAGSSGYVELPATMAIVQDPLVILAAGFMYCVEFFADKTPGVDTGWDAIHTFIRIPAGAMLAAGAVGDVAPAMAIAAGLLGGTVTATAHATKAGTRAMINTSPEPFSNWTASIAEDLAVFAGLWAALNHPTAFLALLVLFLGLAIWLIPKLFRALATLGRKIGAAFKPRPA